MTHDHNRPPSDPTPEQLAAYLDGYLSGPARAEVECWLAAHPDAGAGDALFADVEDDLPRSWQLTQPPEPSLDAWSRVADRIVAGIQPPASLPLRRRSSGLIVAAGIAAAVLLAALIGRAMWPTKPGPAPVDPDKIARNGRLPSGPGGEEEEDIGKEKEPFAVLSPADVHIISMEGDDTHVVIDGKLVRTFVVGEPPIGDGPVELTNFERTRLVGWADPELHFDNWDVPMIVDAVVLAKDWRP